MVLGAGQDVETEEGPPWVAGLAQLLTALDPGRHGSGKQPRLSCVLCLPSPFLPLPEIQEMSYPVETNLPRTTIP